VSEVAIQVEGLGKRYEIGERERYNALRDLPGRLLRGARGRWQRRTAGPIGATQQPEFWALKDVSFEVKRGEVLGIIGRNGAGKSTLLKILTRITEPTAGQVQLHGRVGSLLEVGTGFHPELTGRENVYLNGAILGMKKAEVRRKIDEIVAFAEVEQFIDTPVKRYSSGMQLRLAFSVAAHLDPEILLVDEVLAVGDIAFQKKCLGKMGDVASAGRTILLVSHQMNQIRRLCERALWLDQGRVNQSGPMVAVVGSYEGATVSVDVGEPRAQVQIHGPAAFIGWGIVEPRNSEAHVLTGAEHVVVRFLLQVNRPVVDGHHGIALFSSDSQLMWASATDHLELEPGVRELDYTLPTLPLRPGVYRWHLSLYEQGALLDSWHSVPEMVIGTIPQTHASDEWQGILNVPCRMEVR